MVNEGWENRLHVGEALMHAGVVGAGKVGLSIAHALQHAGVHTWVQSRREPLASLPFIPAVIVLAVADTDYEQQSAALAARMGDDLRGVLVVHCSGRLSRDVLHDCASLGARTAAIHPFQTFASADASLVDHIGWGVECLDVDAVRCYEFVEIFHGTPHRLPLGNIEAKLRYHAAAVAASNLLYASLSLARATADAAHLPENEFLVPIIRQTVFNAERSMEHGTPFGITGPLMRGDVEALRLQLHAMPQQLQTRYALLHLALLDAVADTLPQSTVDAMRAVLTITP